MSPFRMYRRAALALLLLLALLFCQSARSAGSAPMPSTTTVTVSVTLTGKDANGVPFTTVRHLDIPLAGTPDGMAVSAAINGAASGGKAHVAFALDGPTQTLAPSAPPGVAVTPRPTTADGNALPDLAQPSSSPLRFQPGAQGITITDNDASRRFVVDTETSQATGTSIGFRGAMLLSDLVALGGGVRMGRDTRELFASLGLRLSDTQRLMLTGGQLRQHLDYRFPSGKAKAEMTQNSAGGAWRVNLGSGLLDYAEATAYTARTASRDLGAVNFFIDTATLYELWNDPRRIAGSTLNGVQGKLGLRPWEGGRASFGFGQERLRYDLLNGDERHTRATGSLALEQALGGNTRLKFGADAAAAQNRVSVGVDHRFDTLGTLGLDLVNLRGRDGIGNDNRVQLSWNIPLGRGAGAPPFPLAMASTGEAPRAAPMRPLAPDAPAAPGHRPGPGNDGLLDQVATRPTWMPAQVVAKVDTSAGPTRLIAVDKTALPVGSSINTGTGDISIPLGIVVAGIASVTKNGGAFVNAGQFSLSDNNLVVNPNRIVQPAAGVVDVYVVTVNAAGGGTALVTINISHGSVKVDRIVITSVSAPVAPTAGAVGISGTAQVGYVLTGQYTYDDANADAQGTSTFRWLRNGVAISGATAITYAPVAADIATTLSFEVTPVSTVAPTAGTPVVSAATAAVLGAGAAVPPTAGAVSIAGTAQVGQTLTGYYTYADANGDPQGASTFRWLRNGVAIAGATAITYPLANADYGNTVTFEVTPVATTAPTTGTAVMSSATATVVGAGTPAAPTASAVAITGTAQVGQTLTGSYTYADANADPQGASTFRWLRNGVAIAGATAITYTPVAADIATTLSFEVTPISTVAPTAGTPVVSTATAAVLGAGAAVPPTASAVAIVGTAQVGQTLTGSYTYADANGDAQGTSTFRWLRNGSAIAGATASTYTLVAADQGNTITFEVTPVATVAPIMGTAVVSAATAVVTATAAAPTASAVVIVGTAQVGQTLTGYYTYADANGDPQGGSTFRWLRNGVAIAGATASTYMPVTADIATTLSFEVTPVSTVVPATGTTVVSAVTAAVLGAGTPTAPTAGSVAISGTAQVGQTLTGSYTYADANNDPQGASTFRWLRNGVAIAGATAITYMPVTADIATTLSFEVTPVSTVVPATGTPVVSAVTAAVLGAGTPTAPTASSVTISGTAQVGQTLTGNYTYADANSDAQGASTFRWLRNGVAIAGATASTYTLVADDGGNTIAFEVTPVSTVVPATGTAVVSATTATVTTPAAPTASAVSITGTTQVGQTLTGNYTYADANGDPQGASTFRWLRNGVAIAGATAITYMPVTADIATTLSFEVTPVSTVVPATGTPVVSAVTAAVLGAGTPTAPTASSVTISGTALSGQTLTGSYTYADANNDPQGTSTFRWLKNGVAISGATAITYIVSLSDIGTTLSFEVTPVSSVAPATGTPVVSAATAVLPPGSAVPPTASAVGIVGTAKVGQTLAGYYSYADANNNPQGASTFRWLRNGVAIAGATAIAYTPVAADVGTVLSFEVTPVSNAAPTVGTPVVSAATAAVLGADPPTASAVSIDGTAQVGQTLTGYYTYASASGDPQGASTFRWLRNGVAIDGATAITYTPVAADVGTVLSFEVTPVSSVAPTAGTPVVSAATAAVLGAGVAVPPTASAVAIGGTAQVGRTLAGYYTYADVNGDPQGASTFRWLRNGVAIAGATASTYTLVAADVANAITFEVTPVSTVAPTTGTAVVSAIVTIPVAPTASAVSITGTTQAGQTLTGNYTYADANGDAQGASTFRWLRSGVAIVGATASTYTLVLADQGNTITFEVTPVATVAPATGTAVVSAATAAITLPAGYVSQGNLLWMPVTFVRNWGGAKAYCDDTAILGQTGWRLPTRVELSALYASGAMNGQGWTLYGTWSSSGAGVSGFFYDVNLDGGYVNQTNSAYDRAVSCVR